MKSNKSKATMYEPPKEAIDMAMSRTEGIIREWSKSLTHAPRPIQHLAVSIYLQGIEDAGVALAPAPTPIINSK